MIIVSLQPFQNLLEDRMLHIPDNMRTYDFHHESSILCSKHIDFSKASILQMLHEDQRLHWEVRMIAHLNDKTLLISY